MLRGWARGPVAAADLRPHPHTMNYLFKCKAAGDVLMTGPVGDRILRIIGKEPGVAGIIEAAALPAAMQAIEQAVLLEQRNDAGPDRFSQAAGRMSEELVEVSLRQRAWPLLEQMKAALRAGEAIVWGT